MEIPRASTDIALLTVPYDSGHFRVRMGAGPDHLLITGLRERLETTGRRVELITVKLPENSFAAEGSAAFELARQLSGLVRSARQRGAWPLILSGNCGPAALGAIAALGDHARAVVWFDAHADFNTPETSASGFLDGMALATATGCCSRTMAASIPGFQPIDQEQVVLVGARDIDPAEAKRLSEGGVTVVSKFGAAFIAALDSLAGRAREIYLHLDLDVIDPSEGRANSYASPGGFRVSEVLEAVELIADRFSINAAALTSYDPAEDRDGRIAEAAGRFAVALASGTAKASPADRT